MASTQPSDLDRFARWHVTWGLPSTTSSQQPVSLQEFLPGLLKKSFNDWG
jgi:hypothetical protein